MKQVVQPIGSRPVSLVDVPIPEIGPTEVLVRTLVSLISTGTERAVRDLAQANLFDKARSRPDLVRKTLKRAQMDGVRDTLRVVQARLGSDLPLGYSAAGVVVAVGEAVAEFHPGDVVATGGAGWANHAEFQRVPALLCARVPAGVSSDDAAFATVASIPLHGLRLAEVAAGDKVLVQGLGLLGTLGLRLALSAGCDAIGLDVDETAVARTVSLGLPALVDQGEQTTDALKSWADHRGVDAVLVCAASKSPEVLRRLPSICRDRARISIVGDVRVDIPRTPFYEREISLTFARSYGPGRYDTAYEEWGVDYPVGYVRWTEQRNMAAVLNLISRGKLQVSDLISHRFSLDEVEGAYEVIRDAEANALAVLFDYEGEKTTLDRVQLGRKQIPTRDRATRGLGLLGAGQFARSVLLPAFKRAGITDFVTVASAGGTTARRLAEEEKFRLGVAAPSELMANQDVGIVAIATPHAEHSSLVVEALRSGKNVWCEKPLAVTQAGLDEVRQTLSETSGVLAVGLNRRFSPAVGAVVKGMPPQIPKTVTYRVAAGPIPSDHWYADRRQGGRLLGEGCHFIDTCSALIGQQPVDVTAVASDSGSELLLSSDFSLIIRYEDESLANIIYSSRSGNYGKEWVEVLAGTERALIDDFRKVTINGRVVWKGRRNKGHDAAVQAFVGDIASGSREHLDASLMTSQVAIAAVGSLLGRRI